MGLYKYEARSKDGTITEGAMESFSAKGLRKKLQENELELLTYETLPTTRTRTKRILGSILGLILIVSMAASYWLLLLNYPVFIPSPIYYIILALFAVLPLYYFNLKMIASSKPLSTRAIIALSVFIVYAVLTGLFIRPLAKNIIHAVGAPYENEITVISIKPANRYCHRRRALMPGKVYRINSPVIPSYLCLLVSEQEAKFLTYRTTVLIEGKSSFLGKTIDTVKAP